MEDQQTRIDQQSLDQAMRLFDDAVTYGEAQAAIRQCVAAAEKLLTQDKRVEIRAKALEVGIQLATARGKPGHGPYVAADIYAFLLTGIKPLGPRAIFDDKQAESQDEESPKRRRRRDN